MTLAVKALLRWKSLTCAWQNCPRECIGASHRSHTVTQHHHHHHIRLLEVVIRNQWQKHVSKEKWKMSIDMANEKHCSSLRHSNNNNNNNDSRFIWYVAMVRHSWHVAIATLLNHRLARHCLGSSVIKEIRQKKSLTRVYTAFQGHWRSSEPIRIDQLPMTSY